MAAGRRYSIMLSSAGKDLAEHRKQVREGILATGMFPIAMENDADAALPQDLIDASVAKVDEADGYIGLIGYRYGQVLPCPERNPDNLSLTELEFRRARERKIPICMLIMHDDHQIPRSALRDETDAEGKLAAFIKLAKEGRIYAEFKSVDDAKIKAAGTLDRLRKWLDEQGKQPPREKSNIRGQEFLRLSKSWSAVIDQTGDYHGVTIVAPEGYGKSYLLRAFRGYVESRGGKVLELQCVPAHEGTALYPFAQLIAAVSGITDDMPLTRQLIQLGHVRDRQSSIDAFLNLLTLQGELERSARSEGKRDVLRRIGDELTEFLFDLAAELPLLLTIEDAEWSDSETRNVLARLVTLAAEYRKKILLVATFSLAGTHLWSEKFTEIVTLAPLSATAVEDLVQIVCAGSVVPESVKRDIARQAGGNVAAVASMANEWLRTGSVRRFTHSSGRLGNFANTEQSKDYERLYRIALCLNGQFTIADIAKVMRSDVQHVNSLLVRAGDQHVFERHAAANEDRLSLSPTEKEVGYPRLDPTTARQIHELIAVAFKSEPDRAPQIAHHFSEAHRYEDALKWTIAAAEQALQRSANSEVLDRVQAAADLLPKIDNSKVDTINRARLSLEWLSARALMAKTGYASRETFEASERALLYIDKVPVDSSVLYPILYLDWLRRATGESHYFSADAATRIWCRAEAADGGSDHVPIFVACKTLGVSKFFLGQFEGAEALLKRAVDIYEDVKRPFCQGSEYGYELGPGVQAYAAWNYWVMGRDQEASILGEKVYDFARKTEHYYSSAVCLAWHALLRLFQRRWADAARSAEGALLVAKTKGFPMLAAFAEMLAAASDVSVRPTGRGFAAVAQSIESYQATGAKFRLSMLMCIFAEAALTGGRVDLCETILGRLGDFIKETREECFLSEFHRLRAEMLVKQEGHAPDEIFSAAISTARGQKAFGLELRASMSYARWLILTKRRSEAQSMIPEVMARVPHGFPDELRLQALELAE